MFAMVAVAAFRDIWRAVESTRLFCLECLALVIIVFATWERAKARKKLSLITYRWQIKSLIPENVICEWVPYIDYVICMQGIVQFIWAIFYGENTQSSTQFPPTLLQDSRPTSIGNNGNENSLNLTQSRSKILKPLSMTKVSERTLEIWSIKVIDIAQKMEISGWSRIFRDCFAWLI